MRSIAKLHVRDRLGNSVGIWEYKGRETQSRWAVLLDAVGLLWEGEAMQSPERRRAAVEHSPACAQAQLLWHFLVQDCSCPTLSDLRARDKDYP